MRIQQLLGVDKELEEGRVTRSPGLQPGSRGHGCPREAWAEAQAAGDIYEKK